MKKHVTHKKVTTSHFFREGILLTEYTPPKQSRAKETEERFLQALNTLLHQHSFQQTSIKDIAKEAHLTKAAFLKRFGSKEIALIKLYELYCKEAHQTMDSLIAQLEKYTTVQQCMNSVVEKYESLILKHFASNRAMQEQFQLNLEVHPLTKSIFQHCIQMMTQIQEHFAIKGSKTGAYAGAQLLVTLVYNHCLQATPALPKNTKDRQELIADIIILTLKR